MRIRWLGALAMVLGAALAGAPEPAHAARAEQLAAGGAHACVRIQQGALQCWGANSFGQLGDGTTADRAAPGAVAGLDGEVTDVSLGFASSCALSQGAVSCWGRNDVGQLGDGTTTNRTSPVPVVGLPGAVVSLASGFQHACALIQGGAVHCWGSNQAGQLGDGTTADSVLPVAVVGLPAGIVRVAAGSLSTCALTSGGAVWCWGSNAVGQLGDGSAVTLRSVPGPVPSLTGITAVGIGGGHACAITGSGVLWCWGANGNGQLGDGSLEDATVPVQVPGLGTVRGLGLGIGHSCAVDALGAAWCWGGNPAYQLGIGETSDAPQSSPVPVVGLASGIESIAGGGPFTCALRASGTLRCWGSNFFGELGDGLLPPRTGATPVAVAGLSSGVVAISHGVAGESTCAVTGAGEVRCWGSDWIAEAVAGETTAPVEIEDLPQPASAAASECGLGAGGQVGCWFAPEPHASSVSLGSLGAGVLAVTTSSHHRCAVTGAGGARCWGGNVYGELGIGSLFAALTPTDVVGLTSGVQSFSAGDFHTCAATTAGAAYCWGRNDGGQLGDATTTDRLAPVPVQGLSWAVDVSAGGSHSCGLTAFGAVKCWGANAAGQLGNGTTTGSLVAVDVSGLSSGVIAVSAGRTHSCAVRADGGVSCWGSNASRQLGDPSVASSPVPIAVSSLSEPAVDVSAGIETTCALTESGAVLCWGLNSLGEYGDGSRPFARIPVAVLGFEGAAVVPALGPLALALLAGALLVGAARAARRAHAR